MTAPRLAFRFDFASPYSWLSAMRIEAEAEARGVALDWIPFLLGPVFKAQGVEGSALTTNPAKGRYMARDLARIADRRGLAFVGEERLLKDFPPMSLHAARLGIAGLDADYGPALVRAIFTACFSEGRDIADKAVLTEIAAPFGRGGAAAADDPMARAAMEEARVRLRTNTEDAISRGLFGAPSFTVEDELYWGDDRLIEALDAAASG